jgi:peptidoglycan/LPS O-acetylase OafA/YrhL
MTDATRPAPAMARPETVPEDERPASGNGDAPDRRPPSPGATRHRRRLGRFEWALLAIALAGLFFRVGYIASTRVDASTCPDPTAANPVANILCGDALWYSGEANAVGNGLGFIDLRYPDRPGADHPPLTPLVLAPLSAIVPGDHAPVTGQRLIMAGLGFLVIIGIGLLGRRVGGRRGPTVGLIAAGIAAVNANFWMNDVIVMSETVATLGIVASLLAVYRFIDRPSWRNAALVGGLVGLTGLARAELLLLAPIAFVPVVLWHRSLRWPERLGRIAVAGAACVAMLVPWTVYNLARFEEPVLLSTNDGLTLIGANCNQVYGLNDEGIEGDQGGIGFWNLGCALDVSDQVPFEADQSQESRIYRQIGLDYVREHQDRLRTVVEFRLLRGWGLFAPDQMVWLNQGEGRTPWASWTGYVQWWLLIVPAIVGGVLLRRRGVPLWPLASTAVIVTVTLVVFYGIVRFRIAADVAAVVLAAVAIDAFVVWLADRRARRRARAAEAVAEASEAATHHERPDDEPVGAGAPVTGVGAVVRRPPAAGEVVPARHGPTHFPCLDAYRGIGMTMVLLTHAAYSTGYLSREGAIPQFLTPIIARLDISLPMFFVMSGFLLYRPFAKATLQDESVPDVRTFYRRRVLRILPAYWLALAVIGLLFGLQIASMRSWIGNFLFLPAFGVPAEVCSEGGQCHVAYGLTQAWSLGVEAVFYLALPVVAILLHRLSARRSLGGRLLVLLGGLGVIYLSGAALRILVVVADPSWAEQSLLWMPMYADLFAIGMALAVVSAAVSLGRPLPRLFAWFGAHPNWAWAIAGLIFLVVTRMQYPERPFTLRDTDGTSDYLPRQFLYGVASAVWLAPAIFGDQTRGVLRKILSSRPLVYLGAISLSFYLWHLALIEKAKEWTVPEYLAKRALAANPPPDNPLAGVATFTGNFGKVVLISWILSFLVASLLYRYVELPFLRLKDEPLRSLRRRRSPPPPAPDAAPDGANPAGGSEASADAGREPTPTAP